MRAVLRGLCGAVGLGLLAWLLLALRSGQPARAVPRGPRPQLPAPALPAGHPTSTPGAAGEQATGPDAGAGARALRLLLGAVGLGVLAWGGWLLLGLGSDQWLPVGIWLAGGIIGHDALLAPVVVLLGALAVRLVPVPARAPLAVALVVWGTVTLLAVPVLGRFGALSDNPTLLDRPYLRSWGVLTAVVLVAVAVASLLRARRGAR